MANPTLAKTWNFNVNNQVLATGNSNLTYSKMWYLLKQVLVDTGKWTVRSCSYWTGSAFTASTNDMWTSATSVSYGSSTRSWIVLRNTSIAPSFDICIDVGNGGYNMVVYASVNGYNTNGTTSSRPTVVSGAEISIMDNATTQWGWTSYWGPSDFSSIIHCMNSTDGECTRVVIAYQDVCWLLLLDKMKSDIPSATWPYPFVATFIRSGSGIVPNSVWQFPYFWSRYNTTTVAMYGSTEGYNGTLGVNNLGVPNEISGDYPLAPISLTSATNGARGRHGSLYDVWMGMSGLPAGTCYPSDDTRQFAQFGILVFPWNGTAPKTR